MCGTTSAVAPDNCYFFTETLLTYSFFYFFYFLTQLCDRFIAHGWIRRCCFVDKLFEFMGKWCVHISGQVFYEFTKTVNIGCFIYSVFCKTFRGRKIHIPIMIEVISCFGNIWWYSKINKFQLILAYYNMLWFKIPVYDRRWSECVQIDKNIT